MVQRNEWLIFIWEQILSLHLLFSAVKNQAVSEWEKNGALEDGHKY